MIKLKIGGVPEHFNMPWQLLLSAGLLEKRGIDASWTDFQGGTGAMGQALQEGDLDIGILLTEGAIQGIDKGKAYKIISFYVDSPLTWGIHVSTNSLLKNIGELEGKRYAISRFGSGSHLMAMIDAKERGWEYRDLNFIEVASLQGARASFQKAESDIFFWEKFTTKSLVDSGEFRRIEERKTPFSCFVICASHKALSEKSDQIAFIIDALFNQISLLRADPNIASVISKFYNLELASVERWLLDLQWSPSPHLKAEELDKVYSILKNLDLIGSLNKDQICDSRFL